MKPLNQRGQGLIETLMALPIIFISLTVIMYLLYRALAVHFADYRLHEALVCVDHAPARTCEATLRDELGKIPFQQKNSSVRVSKNHSSVRGTIELFLPGPSHISGVDNPTVSIEKELSLPLRSQGDCS
jgi:hypothetical protein